MPSVTSPVLLQFRTYCGTATNRRFGPIGDIVATVRLTSEPIQDGDFGATPDPVVNIL